MPGFDGTGPMGLGPRTGGGFGFCGPGAGPAPGGYAAGVVYGVGRGGIPWGGGRGRAFGGRSGIRSFRAAVDDRSQFRYRQFGISLATRHADPLECRLLTGVVTVVLKPRLRREAVAAVRTTRWGVVTGHWNDKCYCK